MWRSIYPVYDQSPVQAGVEMFVELGIKIGGEVEGMDLVVASRDPWGNNLG